MTRYTRNRIGIFTGSFNPAHAGHLHVAQTALTACQLNRVWWMVSPQNPLKPAQPSYDARVASVEALNLPPAMIISHFERDIGTQYSVDTLSALMARYPETDFVFLMGADNLAQLPRWKDWQRLVRTMPICVIARPGKDALRARLSRMPRQFAQARLPESDAKILPVMPAPVWTFLTAPLNTLSSTQIRRNRTK